METRKNLIKKNDTKKQNHSHRQAKQRQRRKSKTLTQPRRHFPFSAKKIFERKKTPPLPSSGDLSKLQKNIKKRQSSHHLPMSTLLFFFEKMRTKLRHMFSF